MRFALVAVAFVAIACDRAPETATPTATEKVSFAQGKVTPTTGIPATELVREITPWEAERNTAQTKIQWTFRVADARNKRHWIYPS
jgi:hypothetical protein